MSATKNPIAEALRSALDTLRHGTPETNAIVLERLKRMLESMPAAETIAAIHEFLKSGQDSPTGLRFAIGEGGRLEGAPTLRTFLLDELGAISKGCGSAQTSLAAARDVLASPVSADEWSVAMRNVAWADPNSAPYLNQKFREMLGNPEWRQNPSTGLLEAFDIPVYTRDASSIAWLAPLLQRSPDTPPSVNRAAAVAFDRLAEQAPLQVMTYLNANTSVLSESPMMRADYFTKADLSDPAQRAALETYFSRADVTPAEKLKTVDGLAAPGSFVSDNLLTTTPPGPDPAVQTQLLQKAADAWAKRFPDVSAKIRGLLQVKRQAGGL